MKLVDILARELKVWPEGDSPLVQGSFGQVYICGGGPIIIQTCRAEDWELAEVTRAQWQAAVDALVHPTESMALHHQEVGRITRQWNGEGLPPVGTVCEFNDGACGEWKKVEIMYLSKYTILVKFDGYPGEDVEGAYSPEESTYFRPIRTPEQIAEEKRDKVLREMVAEFGVEFPSTSDYVRCGLLYDAGYRKFEIVEGE